VADFAASKHSADISTDSADSDGLEHCSDNGDISLVDNIYSTEETLLLETGEYLFSLVFIAGSDVNFDHGLNPNVAQCKLLVRIKSADLLQLSA
jgi:hypothetical protein